MLDSELDNGERDNNERAGSGAGNPGQPQGPPAEAAGTLPVPAATFQPPQVIFQPPEVAQAVAGDSADAAARDSRPDEEGASGRRRRRRGGRGRGKGSDAAVAGEVTGTAADGGGDAAEPAAAGSGAHAAAQTEDGRSEGASRSRNRGGAAQARDGGSAPAGSGKSPAADTGKGHGTGKGAETGSPATSPASAAAGEEKDAAAAAGAEQADAAAAGDDGESAASRRRRRRRRRGSAAETEQVGPDDPPNTVVHVREPRMAAAPDWAEVQSVKGSTRLEAKKQRRREGRDSGRRRPPLLSESEFLARREAVQRVMLVRQRGDRTQIAALEDGVLVEHYVDRGTHQSMVGNIYLGKVQNVLPSMEAAFVDIGRGRNAVLYAGEINFDVSGLEGQPKRIETALKSGQSVLVQVTKDPVGHKGARLTNQVSLPGRYLVYVPGASMTGISRKLPASERTRLKQILKKVTPEDAGVIVRTAAEGTGEEELARDIARLAAQWEDIEDKAQSASPPELLYSEPDLTIRVVRDIFNEDFSELIVAGDDGWDMVNEYVRYVAPHLAGRVHRWQESTDLFASYRVDEHLAKALERKVWLPSGGSLVIDRTEAMTVIDVNTGKFTGQGGNLEETVTRNNLEAAEEIVRQLRLRDIGGIIVIDFIDMVLESNRELVLRRLLECLARDRTKHQVAEVTSLGLVQMTRKRVGSGLLEAFSQPCECCNGRGLLVSLDLLEPAVPKRTLAGRGGGKDDAAGQGKGAAAGKSAGTGAAATTQEGHGRRRAAKHDDREAAAEGAQAEGTQAEDGGAEDAVPPATPAASAGDKPPGRRRRRKAASPGGDAGSSETAGPQPAGTTPPGVTLPA